MIGIVSPFEPPVNERQFSATSWRMSRKAIVMITNEWPRVRSITSPSRRATPAATAPPTGTKSQGERCRCSVRSAVV